MLSLTTLALSALPLAYAQSSNEQVLGVYMFHRHGDRTAKSTPPANLTDLGYQEVYTSGQYYRSRYVASDASLRINGLNSDIVKQSQIAVSAPDDTVLQNSAMGFLQGLYPPVGEQLGSETLRNGTDVDTPLNGYQLIPVGEVSTGSGSEDNSWLQSAQGCSAATVSSNNYFLSKQYQDLLASTQDFYDSISPVINRTFNSSQISFKNAYTIYDLINVAEIHNSSDDARAVAGMTLAGEIIEFLNATITGAGKQKIGVQFGAYGTFASFFGLADLPSVDPDFYGVADYASSMAFELFTNSSVDVSSADYPSTDELYVRFLWHNGTASNISEPTVYPLFGSGQEALRWDDFEAGMNKFAIRDTEQWCTTCGNFTGTCAAYAPQGSGSSSANGPATGAEKSGNGLSPAVNGVIGAMVTLAVVLGLEALILVIGGYRVVSKKTLAAAHATPVNGAEPKAA